MIVRYGNATATSPGKHGDKDWRVEYNSVPLTIGELLFMLGMFLLAEDRYDGYKRNGQPHEGRFRLWYYVRTMVRATSPELVRGVADSARLNVESSLEKRSPIIGAPSLRRD